MSRILIIGMALSASAPARAQQPDPPRPQAEASKPDPLKVPVRQFEVLLREALLGAVRKFGEWAQQVEPSVYVTQAASPVVIGIPLAEGSVVYTVQQPELVGFKMLDMTLLQRRNQPTPGPDGSNAAARVNATSVVTADPMGAVDPSAEGCARVTNAPVTADQKYAECVKEALYAAILDSSVVLPIKAGQTLTLADIPVDVAVQNQVYSTQSAQLILTIKGEDLIAFHQGRISRDEARKRILEHKF